MLENVIKEEILEDEEDEEIKILVKIKEDINKMIDEKIEKKKLR